MIFLNNTYILLLLYQEHVQHSNVIKACTVSAQYMLYFLFNVFCEDICNPSDHESVKTILTVI